jgi:hypothetical protein
MRLALCVAIAALLRWGLGLLSDDVLPLSTFYPAVLFATLFGEVGVGTFAVALGGIIGWWAFMPPQFAFLPLGTGQQISLLTSHDSPHFR